jgi:hypothetical protein
MEGGSASHSDDARVGAGMLARFASFFSRYAVVAAFVAGIGVVFHVTGSVGPTATANQSVFVLAIVIAQVNLPHRNLRGLLGAPSRAAQPMAFDIATQE